jgi:hypothetical protein
MRFIGRCFPRPTSWGEGQGEGIKGEKIVILDKPQGHDPESILVFEHLENEFGSPAQRASGMTCL